MKGWRCEELLRRKLNRQPTINEISKESGIDAESLIEAFEAATPPESIYESVYDNGEFACLIRLPVKKLRTEL